MQYCNNDWNVHVLILLIYCNFSRIEEKCTGLFNLSYMQSCTSKNSVYACQACGCLKIIIQLNLSTAATLGTDESGRCGEVAVMGR